MLNKGLIDQKIGFRVYPCNQAQEAFSSNTSGYISYYYHFNQEEYKMLVSMAEILQQAKGHYEYRLYQL
ncbi:MAG: hypothetical protein ACLTJG_01590 [[Clostridium] innocuum]